jgi:hypothetical protein
MKTTIQILSFGMLLVLTGCVTLYKPNAIHSPLLKEKGELNTSAGLGLSGCGLFNLQAAYAISNHAGVMMDGMYHYRNTSNDDSSVEKLKMFFGEAGAGYFNTYGNKKNVLFQCYGGGGYGFSTDKISNTDQSNPEMNAKYLSIFVQPGVAYTSKNFEIGFDLRANYVHIFDIYAYLYDRFEWWNTDFELYSDTTLVFVNLEPTVTMKAGGKKLKAVVQLGATIPTINSNSYFTVSSSSMLGARLIKFSVGISYTFGKK